MCLKCLSLVRPPHHFEIKEIKYFDMIPMKHLSVLLCLLFEHVGALAFICDGLSINNSNSI